MESEVGEEDRRGGLDVSARTFRVACGVLLLLAAVIRVWGLDQLPAGLFCDEAGNGYNAFSLLTSGRDEEGTFLPLYVWSFGVSYKNPVFIYSAIPIVGVLGLSEFSIRFTAALWGILGVAAMMWLAKSLFGRRGALWTGLFVVLCPWHLHFSRVAFELIALLPLFAGGLACFLEGVRGRPRWLVAAAVLFALSLYAYAPAKMFVPLFLAGAGLLYWRALLAAGRWTVVACSAAIVTGLPLLVFDLGHRGRAGQYFSETTVWRASRSVLGNLDLVFANWKTFFTREFLFFYGDPLVRHSVPEVGQLFFAMAPLIAIGMLWSLRLRRPEGKLLLWWLVLYPLAPSLMNEVPSASRGFIGVGAFCLLAGGGAVVLQRFVEGDGSRGWRKVAADVVLCLIAATTLFEAARYGYRYVVKYPAVAANAFQYGYGEAIAAMEPRRGDFDKLLLTTSEGNQPQVFPLFYNRYPPEKWLQSFNPGYLVIDPAEFDRYDPATERVLAALRPSDIALFDQVAVSDRVHDPAGREVFVVGEIEQRGRFLREWLMLGTFDNSKGVALQTSHFPDGMPTLDARVEGDRRMFWRRILPQFVRVELHHFYRSAIEPSGAEPVWVCAYATTDLVSDGPRRVTLELDGNLQWVDGWLEGKRLSERTRQIGASGPVHWKLDLRNGDNQLLLKTCRGHADWAFTARLRGPLGGKAPGVTAFPRIHDGSAGDAAVEPPRQVVSGFAAIESYSHEMAVDADYRGDSRGWVEHLYDHDGAVEWVTAPAPASAPTAFAFTAVVSNLAGRAQLWVDGIYALTFDTGRFEEAKRWTGNGFALEYRPRAGGDYRSGVWVVSVPQDRIRPGQPVRLRVSHVDGHRDASFMLKERADTAAFEKLTSDDLRGDV